MKRLYFIEWNYGDGSDRDDLLVMDDQQDLWAQIRRYFEVRTLVDDETGEPYAGNIEHWEAGAFDAEGTEYQVSLIAKPKQENPMHERVSMQ